MAWSRGGSRPLALACTLVLSGLVASSCAVNIYEAGASDGSGGASQDPDVGRVSIAGAATGPDGQAIQAVIDDGVNANADFTATYTGSDSFETNVVVQIEGGTPPDIGFYPQPGAVLEQAAQGNLVALEDLGYDIAELEERYGSYLLSLGEYEGRHYGLPDTINFKSAIWYHPPAFEAAGYEIPETWDDLIALSDQIVEDGKNPWCMGTGSEAATGWPATDWMEDIVLRQEGTDVYDAWVSHELPFDSPEIRAAAETFGQILFTDGYVFGGAGNVASTDFRDAPDPMFGDDPPCYLHRQATFITSFFPEGNEPVEDYDFFPFPPIDGQEGVLMAGGMAAVFTNRAEVKEFLDLYMDPDTQCIYGSTGTGNISANLSVDVGCYENPLIAQGAEALTTALQDGVARFDASDLMPPTVGSGEFWNGMNELTNDGPGNLDRILPAIDAAWPAGD